TVSSLVKQGVYSDRSVMLDTTAVNFDTCYELNQFALVTSIWEVSIGHHEDLTYSLEQIADRWPATKVITEGEFGLLWRQHYKDNSKIDYRFVQRGTGAQGSEKNKRIRWFMNKGFRLALLRDVD